MAKITNHSPGLRGITMQGGDTVWLEPGQSADIDKSKVAGELPDLGRPPADEPADDSEVSALRARVAELEAQLAGGKKPAALSGKSKAELVEIAKAEGVTIEDSATMDDIKSAIELAREEAAKS